MPTAVSVAPAALAAAKMVARRGSSAELQRDEEADPEPDGEALHASKCPRGERGRGRSRALASVLEPPLDQARGLVPGRPVVDDGAAAGATGATPR